MRSQSSPSLEELLTISIATKDRPDVLNNTLQKIHGFGLGSCPLIICDDGSSPPLAPPAISLFPQGKLIRNEQARGQAYGRNRIVQECSTPFVLQLDDDSYPEEGDIKALLAWAAEVPDWLAIAIPFREPSRVRDYPNLGPTQTVIQVSSFVGCAALIHVERFLSIGGYAKWIEKTVEEEEVSLRGLASGKPILTIDLFRIRHDVSNANRNLASIATRSFRNWLLVWIVYTPILFLPFRILHLLLNAFLVCLRRKDFAALQGVGQGVISLLSIWSLRTPLSIAVYRKFHTLPHALDFFDSPISQTQSDQ